MRRADPTGFLPRLPPEAYRGRAVVFWTHTVTDRSPGWLNDKFHAAFRESLLHASIREQLFCPIYTLMPDHFHLIWMGVAEQSDQLLATRFIREQLAPMLSPANWQHQAHDRVLRDRERMKSVFADTVRYIAENPMRAKLVPEPSAWRFTGCLVPGYPVLHPLKDDYWDKFWRLYEAAVAQESVGKLPLR